MKLTANFSDSEFDAGGVAWPGELADNRVQLAQLDQALRDLAGVPGVITSAYRTPEHNAEVGGTEHSQHMKGEANDVLFFLISLRSLAEKVLDAIRAGVFPEFGQIIFYPDRGHVHISLPTLGPRNGEVRLSLPAGSGRTYPFLTDPAKQLPVFSEKQVLAGGASAGIIVASLLLLFFAVAPSRLV